MVASQGDVVLVGAPIRQEHIVVGVVIFAPTVVIIKELINLQAQGQHLTLFVLQKSN